jgi:hypothetical protein
MHGKYTRKNFISLNSTKHITSPNNNKLGDCVIPNEAKTLTLGQKRKPGRPARTVLALARQPNEIQSILDEDDDLEEGTDLTQVQEIPIDMPTPVSTFAQDFDLLFTSPNIDDETFYVNL